MAKRKMKKSAVKVRSRVVKVEDKVNVGEEIRRVNDPATDPKRAKKKVGGSWKRAQGNSKFAMPPASDKKAVVEAVHKLEQSGCTERLRYRAECLLNLLYLRGVREVDAIDYVTGTIQVNTYRIEQLMDNKQPFALEYILKSYRTETGHLASMDLRPTVSVVGGNLDGVKHRAVAQAILNDAYRDGLVDTLKKQQADMLVTCGMASFYVDTTGNSTYPEVVPPWQLFPIPSDIDSLTDLSGFGRTRKVPLVSLKEYLEGRKASEVELRPVDIPIGDTPNRDTASVSARMQTNRQVQAWLQGKQPKSDTSVAQWVELTEAFLVDFNGKLVRYIAVAGDYLLRDVDYSMDPRICPLLIERYLSVGGFYGRSTLFGCIKINTEVEYMLNQLFSNIQDLDLMGMVCIPSSWNITDDMYLKGRASTKAVVYDDMQGPGGRVSQAQIITPQNTGTLPKEIVGIGIDLIDRMMMSSPMYEGQAPGRVDSAAGLQLINEAQQVPMSGPTSSMKNLFVGMYSSTLEIAARIWPSETKALQLTMLDETLAGVYYDPESGGVSISRETIPAVSSVAIGIRSEAPVSEAAMRMSLMEGLGNQTITPMEYRILVRKNGLNIPTGNDAEWQNYRTATLENIMLYDERSAASVQVLPSDMHHVHVYKLLEFMGSPEFRFAPAVIKRGFQLHLDTHRSGIGTLSEGQPAPEEIPAQDMMSPGMGLWEV
jgi:hypothetical protein